MLHLFRPFGEEGLSRLILKLILIFGYFVYQLEYLVLSWTPLPIVETDSFVGEQIFGLGLPQ